MPSHNRDFPIRHFGDLRDQHGTGLKTSFTLKYARKYRKVGVMAAKDVEVFGQSFCRHDPNVRNLGDLIEPQEWCSMRNAGLDFVRIHDASVRMSKEAERPAPQSGYRSETFAAVR